MINPITSYLFKLTVLAAWLCSCVYGVSTAQTNNPIPRDTTYTVNSTYKKLLKDHPEIKPVQPILIKDVTMHPDVIYLTLPDTPFGKRDLHADVFVPAKKEKMYPAVVMVHGGGWRSGDKSMNTPMAQALAKHGFVVMSVEYRLSLEAKYPAALQDIKTAIRWMRKHAKDYSIDPERIAIGGASAGGQLACLTGATNGQKKFLTDVYAEYSSDVQAVIDLDGLLDFTAPESLALKRTRYSADVFWLEGFYEEIPDKWKEASALYSVSASSPPFLFINSAQTRFHAGCKEMVEKLNQYGIYSEVHKLEGAPHSYWLFHPWFEPATEYVIGFLNKIFYTNDTRN